MPRVITGRHFDDVTVNGVMYTLYQFGSIYKVTDFSTSPTGTSVSSWANTYPSDYPYYLEATTNGLVVCGQSAAGAGRIYYSSDDTNWSNPISQANQRPTILSVDQSNRNLIWMAMAQDNGNQIYYSHSTDGGQNWSSLTSFTSAIDKCRIMGILSRHDGATCFVLIEEYQSTAPYYKYETILRVNIDGTTSQQGPNQEAASPYAWFANGYVDPLSPNNIYAMTYNNPKFGIITYPGTSLTRLNAPFESMDYYFPLVITSAGKIVVPAFTYSPKDVRIYTSNNGTYWANSNVSNFFPNGLSYDTPNIAYCSTGALTVMTGDGKVVYSADASSWSQTSTVALNETETILFSAGR